MAAIKRKRRATRSLSRACDKYQKLRSLQCFDLVYARIKDGWPITEIARFIQEDKHEYTEVSRAGLVSVITGFRSSLPPAELIKKRLPDAFIEAKKELDDTIDEVREMEELYRLQMRRVKIDVAIEEKIGKLMPTMTSEIKEARQLLESVANLKMDMGVHSRVPQKHEVSVDVDEILEKDLSQHFGSPTVKKVLENPESRHRVMGTVERFLRITGESATAAETKKEEAEVSEGDGA